MLDDVKDMRVQKYGGQEHRSTGEKDREVRVDKNTEVRLEKDSEYKSKTRSAGEIGHFSRYRCRFAVRFCASTRDVGRRPTNSTLVGSMHLYEKR